MNIDKFHKNVEVPKDAKFVIYKYPGMDSTIQRTIGIHVEKTWESIRADAEYSYGVIFKDKEHNIFPETYIIRWELKDLLEIDDSTIDGDFEQAQASTALAKTGLTTYVKAQLKDILAFIAFDPKTMVMIYDKGISKQKK